MTAWLRLLRPKQWVKNGALFLPLFFAGRADEVELLIDVSRAFAAFSLVASSLYVVNDYLDRHRDALHAKKRRRPFASGAVPPQAVWILVPLLWGAAALVGWGLPIAFWGITAAYWVMNLFYSVRLKHVPVLDVSLIAVGFVLRLFAGGVTADVPLSPWIVVMIFLISVFMALGKRMEDVRIFEASGEVMRPVVHGYNLSVLRHAMSMMGAVVIVAYVLYTLDAQVVARIGNPHFYLTSFFVVLGVLRYLVLVLVDERGGSPTEVLWTDRFLHIVIAGWALAVAWFLYF